MDSRVGIRRSGNEIMNLALLLRREIRVGIQHAVQTVLDILE